MKQKFNKRVSMPFWAVIVIGIILAAGCVLIGLYTTQNATVIAVLGGLLGGLVVYTISFITEIGQLRQLDRFRRLGIKDILNTRHDITYYEPIVGVAKLRVCVMGTSSHRFINDFLDDKADNKVLVDQLRLHPSLKVSILVPLEHHMDAESRTKFDLVRPKIDRLITEFGSRVELRRFDDVVRLSMVLADDELITGPVFPGVESRQSPAVHVDSRTEYGQKCLEHFDKVWKSSGNG